MAEETSVIESGEKLLMDALKDDVSTTYVETGNIGFDMALTNGKGIPIGASILLWADPGCGKSTALIDVSKRLLRKHKNQGIPFKVLYIAVESSRKLLKDMGMKEFIDSHDFIYLDKPLCWRQIEEIYDAILAGKKEAFKDVKMVIIDSVNNVLSDANIGKSVADGDFGTKAKERGLFYSKYFPRCREAGITTFLISQVRQNQEAAANPYSDKRKAAVSWADRHNVDIIIKCSATASTKDAKVDIVKTAFSEKKLVQGYVFKMVSNGTGCKNRYFQGSEAEMYLNLGKGADNAYAIRKFLEFNKFLTSSGGYFSFTKEMCDSFGFPDKKLRRTEVMNLIRDKMGELVEFLKSTGCYQLIPDTDVSELPTSNEEGSDE